MTKQTTNHNWTIPSDGSDEDQWGKILNDFFDDELDEQVTLEGTFANRPSAGSNSPKLYLATDRRIVYYNDGSSWEAVYGLGTDSNPVPEAFFDSVNGGVTESNSITSLLGDGLEVVSNKLQVLESIWNSNNSEIVADVNNTNTTTDALNAGEAETDNETRIEATRSTSTSTITAGNYINIYDGDDIDNRGEFDTNGVFTPDKSGLYVLILSANFGIGDTVAGDRLRTRVTRQSDGAVIEEDDTQSASSVSPLPTFIIAASLTGGESYALKVSNEDSNFGLSDSRNTQGTIFRPLSQ